MTGKINVRNVLLQIFYDSVVNCTRYLKVQEQIKR